MSSRNEKPKDACTDSKTPVPDVEQLAVIVSFQTALYRNFCNAVVKEASIIRQYTGHLLGHCEKIQCLEGFWPKTHGLGVLVFDSPKECQKWLQSDPVFRAGDFLDQVEMYCVPLRSAIPSGYSTVSIMNLDVQFREIFVGEYLKKHESRVRAGHGLPCVAITEKVQKVKGMRTPKYFIMDAWKSKEDFEAWYKAETQSDDGGLRQQTASGDLVLADLKRQV